MNIPHGADFHQAVDRVPGHVDAAFQTMNGDGVAFADGVIALLVTDRLSSLSISDFGFVSVAA